MLSGHDESRNSNARSAARACCGSEPSAASGRSRDLTQPFEPHRCTALTELAPAVRLSGLAAGFHAVAHLPDRANEAHVIGAARDRGVGLYGMSQHRASGLTRPPQLVLGFGNLTDRAIRSGIADIADLLGASRPRN